MLRKRSRRVRLDRLQAVDVVRPLVARALGLAELRLEVAGGGSSEAPLAYLSEDAAQRLRAELLARAAGLHHETPEAPEAVLLEVPLGRLVEATLRSVALIGMLVVAGLPGGRHRGHRRVVAAAASRCRSAWRWCPSRSAPWCGTSGSRWPSRPTASGCGTACWRPGRRPCRRAGCRPCGWSSPAVALAGAGAGSRSTSPGTSGKGRPRVGAAARWPRGPRRWPCSPGCCRGSTSTRCR